MSSDRQLSFLPDEQSGRLERTVDRLSSSVLTSMTRRTMFKRSALFLTSTVLGGLGLALSTKGAFAACGIYCTQAMCYAPNAACQGHCNTCWAYYCTDTCSGQASWWCLSPSYGCRADWCYSQAC